MAASLCIHNNSFLNTLRSHFKNLKLRRSAKMLANFSILVGSREFHVILLNYSALKRAVHFNNTDASTN